MTVTRNKSQLGNPSFYDLAIKTRSLTKRRTAAGQSTTTHIVGQSANEQAHGRVALARTRKLRWACREHDFRTAACASRPTWREDSAGLAALGLLGPD